jgi:hypothetical protein
MRAIPGEQFPNGPQTPPAFRRYRMPVTLSLAAPAFNLSDHAFPIWPRAFSHRREKPGRGLSGCSDTLFRLRMAGNAGRVKIGRRIVDIVLASMPSKTCPRRRQFVNPEAAQVFPSRSSRRRTSLSLWPATRHNCSQTP